jgi:predicted RNase H-like nuclease (RuvC/YqgF family)
MSGQTIEETCQEATIASQITADSDEVSGSVAQLAEEENALRNEKQRLLRLVEELENRLTNEIKTKKSNIATLKTEISDLQKRCDKLAKALNIPVPE